MTVKAVRFCQVNDDNAPMVKFFEDLGLEKKSDCGGSEFPGSVFLARNDWIEQWQSGDSMPAGTMLQLEVDDADVYAERLKSNDYQVFGPMEQHGEKMYFVTAPNGLQLSILHKL